MNPLLSEVLEDFYFGPDGLLRRHDYHVDVAGGFAAAQLVSRFVEAQGLRFPTRRRAYQRGPDLRRIPDPLMVSIDLSDLVLRSTGGTREPGAIDHVRDHRATPVAAAREEAITRQAQGAYSDDGQQPP